MVSNSHSNKKSVLLNLHLIEVLIQTLSSGLFLLLFTQILVCLLVYLFSDGKSTIFLHIVPLCERYISSLTSRLHVSVAWEMKVLQMCVCVSKYVCLLSLSYLEPQDIHLILFHRSQLFSQFEFSINNCCYSIRFTESFTISAIYLTKLSKRILNL